MRAVAPVVDSVRTSTEDLLPAVGFATRGISIRTLLSKLDGRRLALPVALDLGLSVARLIRVEHSSNRVVGALDASRVALMENGAISLVAGGERLAPELSAPLAPPTVASDIYALGVLLTQLFTGQVEPQADELPTNVDIPEELIQLSQSCLDPNPKLRPSAVKFVEKALAVHLSEAQMDEALTERVALVKQLAPEVPKHLLPQQPLVIATEDITGHNLIGLRERGGAVKWVAALVALVVVGGGALWWLRRPAPVAPAPEPAVVAPAQVVPEEAVKPPEPPPPEPEAAPAEPPAPPEVKAAPVRVKKHRKR